MVEIYITKGKAPKEVFDLNEIENLINRCQKYLMIGPGYPGVHANHERCKLYTPTVPWGPNSGAIMVG